MTQTRTNPPESLVYFLSAAVGITVANLYYAQPLVAMISNSLGLAPEAAGLVVTFTQIGYGLGVLLLVPLGDIVENKRLIFSMICVAAVGLLGLAFSTSVIPYFTAAFATGLGTATVQVLVPYSAHLVPEEKRGTIVGRVSSGLMIGIMLSRPIASFVTHILSWHAVFVLSAAMMALLAFAISRFLPSRVPYAENKLRYPHLLSSMLRLMISTPLLRRRAIYQAFLFSAFCLFWTAVPLLLAGPDFHFSQIKIAIFALVGVAGAVSAPFAGKAADRGLSHVATAAALIASSVSFALSVIFSPGSLVSLLALVASAILLDAGVSANLVLGQRAIFTLAPELRSRLNALYIATIFVGGASGSALAAWSFVRGGWHLTAWCGFFLPACALVYFLTETSRARIVSAIPH
ncbi:MAG: MFS transporter [Bdellovibrionota bacterium]